MARPNRVSVPDGTYHVSSRVVNQERWFSDPVVKSQIVECLYGAAHFSGVELQAWAILDNHFHIFVHIPAVPEKYWLVPGKEPVAHAFGIRPEECRPLLWMAEGDSPRTSARPPVGFVLSDEEMLDHLVGLYGEDRTDSIREKWEMMRKMGADVIVDEAKARYCRRMYNLSQFVKTFKEMVTRTVKASSFRPGHLFEGRFRSTLVEKGRAARLVALYIDYNPYKAKLAKRGEVYAWSSYGQACGNCRHTAACRKGYESLWGRPWEEVHACIEAAFDEPLPTGVCSEEDVQKKKLRLTAGQIVKLQITALTRGTFVGTDVDFGNAVARILTPHFPLPSLRPLERFVEMVNWSERIAS